MAKQDISNQKNIILIQFKKYIFITELKNHTFGLLTSLNIIYVSQHYVGYLKCFSLKKYNINMV